MNGCVGLGTNNLELAASFYEQLLEQIGITRQREVSASPADDRAVYFGSKSGIELVVITPWDGKPATAGNGTIVALRVDSHEKIDELHALAIKLGGIDAGPNYPGQT